MRVVLISQEPVRQESFHVGLPVLPIRVEPCLRPLEFRFDIESRTSFLPVGDLLRRDTVEPSIAFVIEVNLLRFRRDWTARNFWLQAKLWRYDSIGRVIRLRLRLSSRDCQLTVS